jgi:chloramphenicol-sensitive protein RarD
MTEAEQQRTPEQHATRRGLILGALAFAAWGFFPLYFPLLKPTGAIEILALRIMWATITIVILISVMHRWQALGLVLRNRGNTIALAVAAFVLSANWLTYIVAVNSKHVVESSLGYFINPLLTVLVGVVVLHETLRRLQWVAVAVGGVAIIVLTLDYGHLPWLALGLAGSFALYGFIKKQVAVAPIEAMAVECFALLLPSIAVEAFLMGSGRSEYLHHGPGLIALVTVAGPLTIAPLMMFAQAANDLPLSVVGLLQYSTPVIQFLIGVLIAHESLPAARLGGFALVWIALILLSADGLRQRQRGTEEMGVPAPVRN